MTQPTSSTRSTHGTPQHSYSGVRNVHFTVILRCGLPYAKRQDDRHGRIWCKIDGREGTKGLGGQGKRLEKERYVVLLSGWYWYERALHVVYVRTDHARTHARTWYIRRRQSCVAALACTNSSWLRWGMDRQRERSKRT